MPEQYRLGMGWGGRLTFFGATLGQVVDLAGIQHVLELAQDAVPLPSSTLRIDEHQQGAAQLVRRRDLEVRRLVMMNHL